jgi:hypothetical protein
MDDDPTTRLWFAKATTVLQRVVDADSRFSASMKANRVTMLSAADDLQMATRDATLWTTMNTCPDAELGERVALMLNTYAEVALTAQRANADTSMESEATIDRLEDLLAIVNVQSRMLDAHLPLAV